MSEYVLSLSKWRCGGDQEGSPTCLGMGATMMKNEFNYYCCLGQFASQAGVSDTDLLSKGGPMNLNKNYDRNFCVPYLQLNQSCDSTFKNTKLAEDLMDINDDETMSIPIRILKIKQLLMSYGHTLIVVP